MKRINGTQLTLNLKNITKTKNVIQNNSAANNPNNTILYLVDKIKEQKKDEEAIIYGNIIARVQHMLD
ncbi:MAG: hypothetical protein HZB79_11550 [Deltaproteobacteria bacterium]|nr:hypothetical protein [Deltaproteobacteria bacterium]